VKYDLISSEKSSEKFANKVLPVEATNCAALFQIVINSNSSPVSFIYELTFLKTLML